jgi:hypothetical protein
MKSRSEWLGVMISLSESYIPWLAEVDQLIGREARVQIGLFYSWLSAWHVEQLTPREAVA